MNANDINNRTILLAMMLTPRAYPLIHNRLQLFHARPFAVLVFITIDPGKHPPSCLVGY
jgi:hypothetical protein